MDHHVFHVSAEQRLAVLVELASRSPRTVMFTRTKYRAKTLARQLNANGVTAVEMHGNLAQNARERNLAAFSNGSATTLVATDIAARGIHVDDVALVVHADPPIEHKAYLHRSGRTARAGSEGIVVTIMTPDQVGDVKSLARMAKIEPIITRVAPGHQAVRELVGVAAPLKPMFAAQNPRQPAPRTGANTNGGNRGGNKSKHRAARDNAARGRR
jgi:superfamily II DNA/RNA helicase